MAIASRRTVKKLSFFGIPPGEPLPRTAAVLAAPDRGRSPRQVRVIGSSGTT